LSVAATSSIKKVKRRMRRWLGRPGLTRRMLNNTLSIFLYHEVSDNPSCFCKKYNLNVAPELFAEQMEFINTHFNIITPDQILEGNYDTPAALITFDDGFSGYFREAVPIMVEKCIPSTIFLNMAPIEGEIFWSGLIVYLTEYDAEFRKVLHGHFPKQRNIPDFLLCNHKIVSDYIATIDFSRIEGKVRDFYGTFANLKDLDSVRGNPLVFFGNHLYNHYNVARLSDEEMYQQYSLNDQRIQEYSNGRSLFAFPFGQPDTCFTERQAELLCSFGVKTVFSSGGRINKSYQNGFYDRIGVDSSIKTIEDLFGLIQWMRIKTALKENRF